MDRRRVRASKPRALLGTLPRSTPPSPMAQQLREVQGQGLVEEFRTVPVPRRHGWIQGIENCLNLRRAGRIQEAAVLVAEVNRLPRAHAHFLNVTAGIHPEFLAPRDGRVKGAFANPARVNPRAS